MRVYLTEERIRRIVNETFKRIINENRVVTFNGKTYPNNGWCVVLSGGSGSGKGYAINYNLPIDGKIIDVDKFKEYFVKMNNNMINGEKYDSSNPSHVSYVHNEVSKRNWKEKYRDKLLNRQTHRGDMLPNLIFDMTGKNPEKSVITVVKKAKENGYKTMLVWVVSSRSESIIRNLQRKRRVSDNILHDIHNSLMLQMPSFLKNNKDAISFIDDAWLIFGSTDDIQHPNFSEEEKKQVCVRLTKSADGFGMNNDTEERLIKYLGKVETNPKNPEVYMSNQDVLNKFGRQVTNRVTRPNWKDLSQPITKDVSTLTFDRLRMPKDLFI